MNVTKTFLEMWISQMLQNDLFRNDVSLTGDMIGLAATGNLPALTQVLGVYLPYAALPPLRNGFPQLPTNQSIQDVIELIANGKFQVI